MPTVSAVINESYEENTKRDRRSKGPSDLRVVLILSLFLLIMVLAFWYHLTGDEPVKKPEPTTSEETGFHQKPVSFL